MASMNRFGGSDEQIEANRRVGKSREAEASGDVDAGVVWGRNSGHPSGLTDLLMR